MRHSSRFRASGHHRLIAMVLSVFAVSAPVPCPAQAIDRPIPPPLHRGLFSRNLLPEYLVGVYYFAGWWPEQPNKYVIDGEDWRPRYPERTPLLGYYTSQRTMDLEIRFAAGYGVHFFQFLWYPPPTEEGTTTAPQDTLQEWQRLNEGLRYYLGSPYREDIRFTVEYVNHPPFRVRDADWPRICRTWAGYMNERACLRIAGRPVFSIHSLHHFFEECGRDPARVRQRLAQLREAARQAGAGDPLVGVGLTRADQAPAEAAAAFDWTTCYLDVPELGPQNSPYPYDKLIDHAVDFWHRALMKYGKPFVPNVPAGWDPRPWKDPRPSFAFPTRQEWRAALDRTREALDANPQFGIPAGEGRNQKMLLIYAWNEFAEGGIVAPTRGDQYARLEVIREVFAQPAVLP